MEKTNYRQIFSSILELTLLSFFLVESNCFHSMKDLIPTYLISSSSNQSAPFTEQNGDDEIDEQLDFEYVPLFDQIIAEEDLYRKMINF